MLFEDLLGNLGPHLKAIILDTATLSVAVNTARAGSLLTMAPFPVNLLGVLARGAVRVSHHRVGSRTSFRACRSCSSTA